jgi:S-adenosylmethionine:tRNA ribosyltransferase-isomerase
VRPGRKLPVGERILFGPDFAATVLDREEHGQRILELHAPDVWEAIFAHGHVPLPPYIGRADEAAAARIATATRPSTPASAAASPDPPPGGLHFDTLRVLAAESPPP